MILLDTQAALWLAYAPERLGVLAKQAITDADSVAFSAISIAEVTIKRMLGRLNVPVEVARHLERSGLRSLPFTDEHASAMEKFPDLARHDPFDRMIIAQARVERAHLATSDRVLLGLGLRDVIDARR